MDFIVGRDLECPFVDVEEAAKFLHLEPKTLQNMRWNGMGPKYRKHGRKVVYHKDDLFSWSLGNEISQSVGRTEKSQQRV